MLKNMDFLELERLDIIFGLFTTAGLVLILLCPLGIVGTVKERPMMLKMYASSVAFLIVVQLITGLMSFTYGDEINQLEADSRLYSSINRTMIYWTKNNHTRPPKNKWDIDTEFWTVTQRDLHCCGAVSYLDWTTWNENNRTDVLENYGCHEENYFKGCGHEIRHRVSKDATYIGIAAIAVLVVEIATSFLSAWRAFSYYNQKF